MVVHEERVFKDSVSVGANLDGLRFLCLSDSGFSDRINSFHAVAEIQDGEANTSER